MKNVALGILASFMMITTANAGDLSDKDFQIEVANKVLEQLNIEPNGDFEYPEVFIGDEVDLEWYSISWDNVPPVVIPHYQYKTNRIFLNEKSKVDTLAHELVHWADVTFQGMDMEEKNPLALEHAEFRAHTIQNKWREK